MGTVGFPSPVDVSLIGLCVTCSMEVFQGGDHDAVTGRLVIGDFLLLACDCTGVVGLDVSLPTSFPRLETALERELQDVTIVSPTIYDHTWMNGSL